MIDRLICRRRRPVQTEISQEHGPLVHDRPNPIGILSIQPQVVSSLYTILPTKVLKMEYSTPIRPTQIGLYRPSNLVSRARVMTDKSDHKPTDNKLCVVRPFKSPTKSLEATQRFRSPRLSSLLSMGRKGSVSPMRWKATGKVLKDGTISPCLTVTAFRL